MFRSEGGRRVLERRWFRYALASILIGATVLGVLLLFDVYRRPPEERDVPLAGAIVVVLVLAAISVFQLYKAYVETRATLSHLKLQAHDILQSLSIGVITTDISGKVTTLNPRARELTGVTEQGLDRPYSETFGNLPVVLEHLERMVVKGEDFGASDVEISRNGTAVTLRIDGRFMLTDQGTKIGTILQLQDVSQLKLLDLEMRRTERLAGLGTLAAGIAHEIKNPLSALQIHAQLLDEAFGPGGKREKTEKYLDVIQSEIRRLQETVEKYVSFARPRRLERTSVSLEGILESVLSLVSPECEKRRVRVVREGFSPSPRNHRLDEGQLQQAFLNIVINAIQSMENGGDLTCRLGRRDSFLEVTVSDTGGGIPEDVRIHIFDLFYTTRKGGTGLGLYVAQRIVAEHGGFIHVKSNKSGSMFTVGLRAEEGS